MRELGLGHQHGSLMSACAFVLGARFVLPPETATLTLRPTRVRARAPARRRPRPAARRARAARAAAAACRCRSGRAASASGATGSPRLTQEGYRRPGSFSVLSMVRPAGVAARHRAPSPAGGDRGRARRRRRRDGRASWAGPERSARSGEETAMTTMLAEPTAPPASEVDPETLQRVREEVRHVLEQLAGVLGMPPDQRGRTWRTRWSASAPTSSTASTGRRPASGAAATSDSPDSRRRTPPARPGSEAAGAVAARAGTARLRDGGERRELPAVRRAISSTGRSTRSSRRRSSRWTRTRSC